MAGIKLFGHCLLCVIELAPLPHALSPLLRKQGKMIKSKGLFSLISHPFCKKIVFSISILFLYYQYKRASFFIAPIVLYKELVNRATKKHIFYKKEEDKIYFVPCLPYFVHILTKDLYQVLLAANVGQQNLKESRSRCFLWFSFMILSPLKYVWRMLVIYFKISAKCDYW